MIAEIEACCVPLMAPSLSETESERLAGALRIVADPTRLRLINLLGAAATGEACVCELTAPLGLTQPTVSHHLRVLTEAGLVDREQRGRWVFYRLRPEPLAALRGALAV